MVIPGAGTAQMDKEGNIMSDKERMTNYAMNLMIKILAGFAVAVWFVVMAGWCIVWN